MDEKSNKEKGNNSNIENKGKGEIKSDLNTLIKKNNNYMPPPPLLPSPEYINDKDILYKNESCLINKIKSTYIIQYIFNYIQDNNFQYKLFNYSKLIHQKLNIRLDDYISKYIEQEELKSDKYPSEDNFKKIINNNTIYISYDHKSKNKYYKKINQKNISINYSAVYYIFYNFKNIDFLKELKIDFNRIKKMSLMKKQAGGKDKNKEDSIDYLSLYCK